MSYVAGSFISFQGIRTEKSLGRTTLSGTTCKGNVFYLGQSAKIAKSDFQSEKRRRLRTVCNSFGGPRGVFIKDLPRKRRCFFQRCVYPILTTEHNGSWAADSWKGPLLMHSLVLNIMRPRSRSRPVPKVKTTRATCGFNISATATSGVER